jgi:hypothetical protein
MGYGIYSNSFQGDYKKVLAVCSANTLNEAMSPLIFMSKGTTPLKGIG